MEISFCACCGFDPTVTQKRSNRTWDFENTSSKYIELFGEHVACLTADVPHGVVQATFDKGRQDLKIKNEQTFIGKGRLDARVEGWAGNPARPHVLSPRA